MTNYLSELGARFASLGALRQWQVILVIASAVICITLARRIAPKE